MYVCNEKKNIKVCIRKYMHEYIVYIYSLKKREKENEIYHE